MPVFRGHVPIMADRTMNTRLEQMALPFLGRGTGGLRWMAAGVCVVTLLMLYVGGKVQIVRLGYRIDELENQKRELERANRALQIEASSLAAPARIEELAMKRLGMVRPSKENVVVVKRLAGPGPDREQERGTR